MNKTEICGKIKKAIRQIVIEGQRGILSAGTGIVVKPDGTLLTAKHVIEKEGIGVYHGRITASGSGSEQIEYQPAIVDFGFDLELPDMVNPIDIDMTVLKPTQAINNADFIPLSKNLAEVGTDILIGGFPDDIKLPLDVLEKLNTTNPEMASMQKAVDSHFKYFFRQLMFKHGMVGCMQKIQLNDFDVRKYGIKDLTSINVSGAAYWLDTHLTYGASGGPIVDGNGELIGIVCQKAFTDSKMQTPSQFPSGNSMGLSHQLISWLIDYL